MKILLGGVPFGRNNIGDEAILACVVRLVREAAPGAHLTVSTHDPATAERLGVEVCPLYGFDVVPYDSVEMQQTLARHDVYLWAGATGLSDYPDRAVELLSAARLAGCRRIVWNVGMNDELNPAKFRLQGRRLKLARLADRLTLGSGRFAARWEENRAESMRIALGRELASCDLLVVRDPGSARELGRCHLPAEKIVIGADSALWQHETPWPPPTLSPSDRWRLDESDRIFIGLCISAQRDIAHKAELAAALDELLLSQPGDRVALVGLPMNPLTDLEVLHGLQALSRFPDRFMVLSGIHEPADITALARRMHLLISSRLHLLILGSIHHVPLVGISRGSKVDQFLLPYGLKTVGSVDDADFTPLVAESLRLLDPSARQGFVERSQIVRQELLGRLDHARHLLAETLAQP